MKLHVWYRATYKDPSLNFSIVVKRISDTVTIYDEFGGWVSYEVIKYPSYNKSGFVPDNWILIELSGLEQELL